MLKLTIKNLLEKKIRFALTSLAVVLGVTFTVAVFTMTDSLRASFDGLAQDIAAGTDLTVRSTQIVGDQIDRAPVPAELDDVLVDVEGVDATAPGITVFNTIITNGDGEAIIPQGPPAIGASWSPYQFFIADGREPTRAGEFATDATTALNNELVIGETYSVTSAIEQREFELVGIFNFGSPDENRSLGQTMAAFELSEAQQFLGREGVFSSIGVRLDPNADKVVVQAAVQDAVGTAFEVVTSEVIEEETTNNFNEAIDIFNNILLGFAFVIVFVSAFIINNTFQIVVAQRIRELGLLRAIGATGSQVRNSVLLEAVLVGVFSTVTGLGLGLLGGKGLRFILNVVGFSLPAGPARLETRTIVWAAAIGIGITVLSSIIPARRARKISPIAAIQNDQRLAAASLTRRLATGGAVTAIGGALLVIGLFVASETTSVLSAIGVGAVLVFIGVNTLSPSFARPVATLLGWPIAKLFGTSGQIAQGNAARSPRRTASTAGALMIGLALVGMAGVVGASLTDTFRSTFDDSVQADYFIQSPNSFDPTAGFAQEIADEVEALEEFESVVRYRFGLDVMQVQGVTIDILSADFDQLRRHLDGDVVAGAFENSDPSSSIAIHVDPAEDLGLSVGDTLDALFPDNAIETLTVVAIYENATVYNANYVIPNEVWEAHMSRQEIAFLTARIAGFSDDLPPGEQQKLLDAAAEALAPLEERFSSIDAQNQVEFRQSQEDQLNSFLAVIFVMLALSLIIALIGIANTLALSVFERTREIGLLRAVGMTRRQLRRAIRWEAVIVAIFGAILGIILGVIFGVAAVIAIPDSFISTVTIPWSSLIVYVAIAAVAGIVAAILPARRASRLDILEAISQG
ncbi:MAG: FtsX-like permease family protein [Acidimicrobiales bacterium]|nr:FtsX-like permease family protein [Acidimicrobiales bacterium]MDG2217501.1 FtsX-like permease family protein [Acidimicrobiales bacterium]